MSSRRRSSRSARSARDARHFRSVRSARTMAVRAPAPRASASRGGGASAPPPVTRPQDKWVFTLRMGPGTCRPFRTSKSPRAVSFTLGTGARERARPSRMSPLLRPRRGDRRDTRLPTGWSGASGAGASPSGSSSRGGLADAYAPAGAGVAPAVRLPPSNRDDSGRGRPHVAGARLDPMAATERNDSRSCWRSARSRRPTASALSGTVADVTTRQD
jgi:hypothetical protein